MRAAECAALAGFQVTLFDAKPSVGRKFLVAGKGGLNLTHAEPLADFARRYAGPDQAPGVWQQLLAGFDPSALRQWAAALGVATFEASSGRVYPTAMKAAPLLRRWKERLRALGVKFEMNHRCCDLQPGLPHRLSFENGDSYTSDAVIFALGGGSWPQTGSDGRWVEFFKNGGIAVQPLQAANCGWEHPWPAAVLALAEGQPLKNLVVRAGDVAVCGELMVTRYGLEGGALYQLGATLRAMPQPVITIDFKPTFSGEQLVAKMQSVKRDFLAQAAIRWKLSAALQAILAQTEWHNAVVLAQAVKSYPIELGQARPLAEAISTAGGVAWKELDAGLMVKRWPGVFVAGEMIDWEAPTGGYLMQGCFATGSRAAASAVEWLAAKHGSSG
jgi:uncharacterized flavoprotein (TIGR03862 family)